MADRFEELRTFVAIAEAGGVNAAAATLGIARSAVSRRLSDLEARLGVTLVERSTRSFALTDAGRSFGDDACRLLADLAGVEARVGGGPAIGGNLLVAIDGDLLPLIAEALATFTADQPKTSLTIRPPAAGQSADVTVSGGSSAKANVVGEARRVVVASPGYLAEHGRPDSPASLKTHRGIRVDGALDEWVFRRGVRAQPNDALSVADTASALLLATAGAGIAHLWEAACRQALADGAVERVMTPHEPTAVTLSASATSGSAAAKALVACLVAAAKASS